MAGGFPVSLRDGFKQRLGETVDGIALPQFRSQRDLDRSDRLRGPASKDAAPELHISAPDIDGDADQPGVIGGEPRQERRDSLAAAEASQLDQALTLKRLGPVGQPAQRLAQRPERISDSGAELS